MKTPLLAVLLAALALSVAHVADAGPSTGVVTVSYTGASQGECWSQGGQVGARIPVTSTDGRVFVLGACRWTGGDSNQWIARHGLRLDLILNQNVPCSAPVYINFEGIRHLRLKLYRNQGDTPNYVTSTQIENAFPDNFAFPAPGFPVCGVFADIFMLDGMPCYDNSLDGVVSVVDIANWQTYFGRQKGVPPDLAPIQAKLTDNDESGIVTVADGVRIIPQFGLNCFQFDATPLEKPE